MASGEAICQVLSYLKNNGDNRLEDCYVANIAREMEMRRARVHKAVQELVEHGHLRREQVDGDKKILVLDDFPNPPEDLPGRIERQAEKVHPWA